MPRVRRKAKPRHSHWLDRPRVVAALEHGHDFRFLERRGTVLPEPLTVHELVEAWAEIGEEVTEHYRQTHPDRMPFAWWWFDAVEPRRRLDGRKDAAHEDHRRERLDCSTCWAVWFPGPGNIQRESEAEYLRRLDMEGE